MFQLISFKLFQTFERTRRTACKIHITIIIQLRRTTLSLKNESSKSIHYVQIIISFYIERINFSTDLAFRLCTRCNSDPLKFYSYIVQLECDNEVLALIPVIEDSIVRIWFSFYHVMRILRVMSLFYK